MSEEFRQKLRAFAERAVSIAPRCTNEESTKLFLVLPFLSFLGYDDRNPDEVCPEHGADFSDKYKNRVDFAIMKAGKPVIAIECKALGAELKDERGQLRSYFNAAPTVKMGVITDGLIYEFYADSDDPNMMDQNAFLHLNLREVAKGKIEDSVDEGLRGLQKSNFDPENIGAEAKRKLIFQNVVQQIANLAEEPSETLVRTLLQNAGVTHVRTKALDDYRELVRGAFREFVNLRILQRLDLPTKDKDSDKPVVLPAPGLQDPTPTGTENQSGPSPLKLEVFDYTKRRLAFLVKEDFFSKKLMPSIITTTRANLSSSTRGRGWAVCLISARVVPRSTRLTLARLAAVMSVPDTLADVDQLLSAAFVKRVGEGNGAAKRIPNLKAS